MRPFIPLTALLGLATASLKTPRTASIPSQSPTPSTIATAPPATTAAADCSLAAGSDSLSQPQSTSVAVAETRCTAVPINGQSTDTPTGTASSSTPKITASPEFDPPGGNFHEIGAKFKQTTYWSCVTFPLETHCGWHEPILDAGAGRVGCGGGGEAALRAGIVAGVVAGGLVLGM
ncbi:hypothetical protein GGR54DRAFT_594971 [Hypoxylon sp. NC1633]|nr:hypothetical protein GGR54DRAFT_594971 [Hypoxylon sp. NC1633]